MGPSGLLENVSSEDGFLMCRRGKAILRCRVPTAMRQLSKVKALVETGVGRLQVMEQLGISKVSYYRCLGWYFSLMLFCANLFITLTFHDIFRLSRKD